MPTTKNTTSRSTVSADDGCTAEDRARVSVNSLLARWSVPGTAPMLVDSTIDPEYDRYDRPIKRQPKNVGRQPGLKTFAQTGDVTEVTVSEAGRLVATIEMAIEQSQREADKGVDYTNQEIERENKRHAERIAELERVLTSSKVEREAIIAAQEVDLVKAVTIRNTLVDLLAEQG